MSYHTCLKEATRNGTLPNKYRKTIPRSTLWRWKNENPDKYIGTELCQNKHNLQTLLQLAEKYPSLFFAYGRLVKVVLDIVAATLRMDSLNGGPGNVNRVVDHFLQQSSMTREIALKDISFSNSMIEAANKSLKYRYLFPKQVENSEQLQKVLKNAVEECNYVKPHASLHGYTPAELYHGLVLQTSRFSTLMQQAREQRVAYHQNRACRHC